MKRLPTLCVFVGVCVTGAIVLGYFGGAIAGRARSGELLDEGAVFLSRFEAVAAILMTALAAGIIVYGWRMQRHGVVIDHLHRREDDLRRANAAFENAMSGLAFVDTSGHIAFVSRSFAEVLGYSQEDMLGLDPKVLVHPDDAAIFEHANEALRTTGRNEVELRVRHKSGAHRDLKVIRVPSLDEHGNRAGHYTFVNDITEQRAAEAALRRSEERLFLAARASRSVIFEHDLVTNRLWIDESIEEQFGIAVKGTVDPSFWTERMHPDDRERVRAERDRAVRFGGPGWSSEYRIRRDDGTWTDVESHLSVIRDASGAPVRIIAATSDVSERNRATAALRKSEERFMLATRATNDVIFEWDIRTNACWVNERWQTQFLHQAWGKTEWSSWSDAIHPDEREGVLRSIARAMASTDSNWSCEYRLRRGDGTYADVETRAYIVRDAFGQAVRAVGALADITERKRNERVLTGQLLNSAADAIVGTDLEARVTFINASAAQLLGWTTGEKGGFDLHSIMHARDEQRHAWSECPLREAMVAGRRHPPQRVRLPRRDGSFVEAEFQVSAVRDGSGEIVGGVVTAQDVTERRAIERMKDEFISVVSHELRTPLTSIRGALGLLANNRVGDSPEKAKRMLDIALSNTDRLVRLLNDILDIERMESGKITLDKRPWDVESLLTQAAELMRPIADKSGIRIECEPCREAVRGDHDRLLQTLTNLLSNAIKFSAAGSKVMLAARRRAADIEFEVRDFGRGIPGDKLELIFERFQQVDASDAREKGGTGLGLAICRSIVQQHGGEIRVVSVPGEGSRFLFTVPRCTTVEKPFALGGSMIMICDDDELLREGLALLLEQCGYRTHCVASGEELLAHVDAVRPDVILLDFMTPGLRGDETLARLKAQPETAAIPAFIVSAFSREDAVSSLEGLAGWIQKPVDGETLVREIEVALANHASSRSLQAADDPSRGCPPKEVPCRIDAC